MRKNVKDKGKRGSIREKVKEKTEQMCLREWERERAQRGRGECERKERKNGRRRE